MKPIRAFFFLFIVLALFVLAYLRINKSPDVNGFFAHEEYDIERDSVLYVGQTSIQINSHVLAKKPIRKNLKTENTSPFVYAETDSVHLNSFFSKLKSLSDSISLLRIIYFGDSQIEGDRITSSLRKVMQERFGGKGPGLIPAGEYYNPNHQLLVSISEGWKYLTFQDSVQENKSLLFRNTHLSGKGKPAWINIARVKSANTVNDYENFKLFYLSPDTCKIDLKRDGKLVYTGILPADSKINTISFLLGETPGQLHLDFESKSQVMLQALSLESPSGIMVDNISLRGLSYPSFTASDTTSVKQMLRLLTPGMFILHFGINLVPRQSENYSFIKMKIISQVQFLKQVYPEVPVLIIGVSDMAEKKNAAMASSPNIQQIKQLQIEVASETNSVFWDLEEFMGGAGSMVKWVNANPPLAGKDYTHFTRKGAELVGSSLAEILLHEYDKTEAKVWVDN